MAIVFEKNGSREKNVAIDSPTRDLRYQVQGTENDGEVDILVQANIPAYYDGYPFQSYHIAHLGAGVWDVDVRYAKKEPKEIGSSSFSFDTTGGKEKITRSRGSISYPRPGATATDHKGAVNVQGDKVEGVDVTMRQFSFSIKRVIQHPLPSGYIEELYRATGKVNNDTVVVFVSGVLITFYPGELLFHGASGGQSGVEAWEIDYKFAGSPNAVDQVFGDITGVSKPGWYYLWTEYDDEPDSASSVMRKVPRQVNVDQVYEEAALGGILL